MNANNQTLVIFFLGCALIMSMYLHYTTAMDVIIGIFGGIYMQKSMTEKQKETLEQYHIQKYQEQDGGEDVQ